MKNKIKRITFFINFIDSFGMTRAEFFRSISMNRNTYINWLNADDISLRKIFDICTRVKYRCSIYLEPKNEEEAEKYRKRCLRVNNYLAEYSKRTDFLKDFLDIEKLTQKSLCDAIGASRSRVTTWFDVDSVSLSKIFEIAQVFDRNVHFVFTHFEEKREQSNYPGVISEVNIVKKYSFQDLDLDK